MLAAGVPAALASTVTSDLATVGGVLPCLGTAPATVVWAAL